MRRYLALTRASFQEWMAYRLGFFFTIFGNIVYLGVAYYLWSSIYEHSTIIRGMTFNETFIYVALGSAVFILLKTYADWIISHEIREGIIAIYLTKPLDFQLYSLFSSLGGILMNLAAISLPTILVLTLVFKIQVTLGLGLFLFPISIFFAVLISFCFDYFIGLSAFYTESTWGIAITKDVIITVFSGALLPLQFFPDAIQKVLLMLPFQAIYHTPLMMITRPDQGWDVFGPMLLTQIFWIAALFLLTRLYYNQAVKVLRISGG